MDIGDSPIELREKNDWAIDTLQTKWMCQKPFYASYVMIELTDVDQNESFWYVGVHKSVALSEAELKSWIITEGEDFFFWIHC
jgi:hypothetical protein